MSYEQSLSKFIISIKANKFPLPKFQLSTFGNLTVSVCYDEESSAVMNNEATTGMDLDPALATLKALTEYFERKTFQFGVYRKDKACINKNSDGVACMPRHEDDFEFKAKENALNEAIERYVWATWWDDARSSFDLVEFKKSELYLKSPIVTELDELIKYLERIIEVDTIYLIKPGFESSLIQQNEKNVIILFLKTKFGGFVSGGACEDINNTDKALIRSLSELIRHTLGYNRFLNSEVKPQSFYEKRLYYFACGKGRQIVNERLNRKGTSKIKLPDLEVDQSIESFYDSITYTHRCLFKNQPPFVDGVLERLCL